ncbi:hypothetical protein RHGRI_035599 [Rhododendron griersonianum]|uniref:SWIM-type domain-containing protein n=1 Tax=Rhododendron griersonianum TaxID=479676 RepID=A0AAV6HK62_9ERIC|nr:hypothetical protein RHGRI_035599 [Rhododendron griersonianum]
MEVQSAAKDKRSPHRSLTSIHKILENPKLAFAFALLLADALLVSLIIAYVPYTKIDWDAYMSQFKVHLTNKTCGCRKWDISGIPCIHAIAALSFLNMDIFDYVHECYKVDTYLKTYNNLINPINGRDLWPTTENPTLLPPDVKKRVGRPKKARRREPEEPAEPNKLGRKGIKMTCRLCGNVGHNRRSCKRPAKASGENEETSGTVASGSNVGSVAGAQGSGQTVQSGGTMRNASSGQCNGQTGQMNATSKQGNTRRPKLLVKKARKVNQSEGGSIVMSK